MSTQSIFPLIETGDLAGVAALLDADPGLAHARLVATKEDGTLPRGIMCLSALGAAAEAGHLAIVELLIERGADIYGIAQHGYPAVASAHWKKQQHIVDYFLGPAAAHPTMQGAPTYGLGIEIHLAARNGWTELVQKHIALDPLAVHGRGLLGDTPLHWASHNGHEAVVLALLAAGADIEADEIGLYGGKPLHWASEHEPHIVRLLLARGADPNSRNLKNGHTPLIMCARQREDCAECARLLLEAGADTEARNFEGKTALETALERGHLKVAEVLGPSGV